MNLETYLKDKGVDFDKHTHSQTFTAQGLADAEHVSGYQVAKPVIVKGAQDFIMCVVPAPKHVNLGRVAMAVGEPTIRLASEDEMEAIFKDCELGAEPPIGKLYGMPTIIDQQLRDCPQLIIQAGKHTESIRLSEADFERICEAQFAEITM